MNKIEDEIHFLLECPFYLMLRKLFFDVCQDNIDTFKFRIDTLHNTSDVEECFNIIMCCKKVQVVHAMSIYIWRAFCKRFSHLKLLLVN